MDKKELNSALKSKKLLTDASIAQLEKELGSLKVPEPWEDFLLEKKILTEDQLLAVKSEATGSTRSCPRHQPAGARTANERT